MSRPMNINKSNDFDAWDEGNINIETIFKKLKYFIETYKSICLIAYNKVKFSNCHILDKLKKKKSSLKNLNHQILENTIQ